MDGVKRFICDEDRSCEYEVIAVMREDSSGPWILYADALAREAALREELANAHANTERYANDGVRLTNKLTAAEQRNAAILGKQTKCKECGSDALFWFALNTARNGIQQGRLNTSDVTCVLVLGCNDCSATLKTVSADRFAERMTAALKPTESGASHTASRIDQ